jgi:hypothetical protein
VKRGHSGLGLTRASDESAARRLVRGVGKAARVLGPVGAVIGALAGSDPLEAVGTVDRAGGGGNFAKRDYKRKDGSYVKYDTDAKRLRTRPKAPALKGRK